MKKYTEEELSWFAGLSETTGVMSKELKDSQPTAHFCPDWDFLVIWEGCSEFEACLCPKEVTKDDEL